MSVRFEKRFGRSVKTQLFFHAQTVFASDFAPFDKLDFSYLWLPVLHGTTAEGSTFFFFYGAKTVAVVAC